MDAASGPFCEIDPNNYAEDEIGEYNNPVDEMHWWLPVNEAGKRSLVRLASPARPGAVDGPELVELTANVLRGKRNSNEKAAVAALRFLRFEAAKARV
jgi:hypothetical protein